MCISKYIHYIKYVNALGQGVLSIRFSKEAWMCIFKYLAT